MSDTLDTSDTRDTPPADARWEAWDRNRLLKLVERLSSTTCIGIFHHNKRMYSVCRAWDDRGVDLRFEDREGEPQAVVMTKTYKDLREGPRITWLGGGLRAWVDALEISRDELLEALLAG